MSDDNDRVAWPIVETLDAAAVRLKLENADLRAMLREIRRTVIASVRGEEHAASLTDAEIEAHAVSTPVDVGNLVARMRSAEAARDALSSFSRNNEDSLASAVDQLAILRAHVAALTAERDAAQAIIAGRTTPPSDAEIAAHHAAGGEWLGFREDVRPWCHGPEVVSFTYSEEHERSARICSRFWALDAEGRPCAWPVVEGERCE